MLPAADIFKKFRRVVPDSVGRLLFVMGMFPLGKRVLGTPQHPVRRFGPQVGGEATEKQYKVG